MLYEAHQEDYNRMRIQYERNPKKYGLLLHQKMKDLTVWKITHNKWFIYTGGR